ncbi:MAG: glycogen-binding domain-containing protein [Paludibacteraceae bacterium]|nr:glycogen-binding domain-containing protein [Paludibacteraceae bacterium]
MKRSILLLTALAVVVSLYAGQAVIDFSANLFPMDSATYFQQDTITYVSGEVTFTAIKAGTNNVAPRVDKDHFRLYKGNSVIISCPKVITQIDFTNYGTSYNMSSVTVDVGTLADKQWTGNAGTVKFVAGAQTRIKQIVVTYIDDSTAVAPVDTIEQCYTIAELKSVYQALSLASGSISAKSYTARGYVTKWSTGYPTYQNATFYIDDTPGGSTTDIQCYRLEGLTTADNRKYVAGDYVEVRGQLQNYNGKMEIVNGTVHLLNLDTTSIPQPVDTTSQPVDTVVTPVPQILTMTCAEARAAAMALSNGETGIDSVIVTGYVSYTNGTVSKGQQTFWMSDRQDTAMTFQAYWCNLPQNDLTALNVGDKVRINGHLTNYNGTNFEMKNGDVTILERQVITIDTIATTVCEAIAEAESLAVGEITSDFYTMTGVVDSVISSIDSYQRQSFTMSCSTNGKMIEAYKLQMENGVAAQKGDTVLLFGKLQNYNSIPEVISGTAEVIGAYVPEDIVSDPLLAYLQKNFDINNNVVFVCSFAEEVCADIVMVGTYKMSADSSWVTDPAQLIHMQQVPLYPEWYVAAIPYTEGLLAKPVQLLTDGTFSWSFQVGDTASWQYVAGNEMFVLPNGFVGECDLEFPSAGVYVYRSLYFRNHTTPCDANLLTYTVTLMAPDCGGYEPAIIGTFTDWSEGIPMQRNSDGSYTAVITTYKGFEFKFRQAGISDWSNEIYLYDEENDLWYANPNLTFEDDTDIFINYFESKYSQCGSVASLTSRAKLVWPVVADDRVLPTYPGTIVSDFRDNGTNSDNHFFVWGEGSGDSFVQSYYGEYIPTGGSVNSSYSYLSYTVGTLGWSGAGLYVGGVREWMSADLLRRYIVTNPDKFFLHIAVKARDNGSHSFWILGNEGYGITLGSTPVEPQFRIYQDFPRDGKWHELNIPMVLFAEALRAYTIDTADNVFAMLSGGEPGVTIGLDNVYFFCTERFANLNPPLARVVTEPEVAIDGHSTEPLYSEEPELTINADVNATIAVTDGYAILFDGEELTITSGDSVIVSIRAPWPIIGNGTNTLYISANIIISSSESSLPSSSATKRRLRQEAAGETPVLNDGAIRHPAISRFADVVLADGIQLCAVYYTDDEGNTREGDPSRVVYHAAEQAYGEVDVDTQSFTPATSLVFADSNFYTDYIDGKIEIVDDAIINIGQGNKSGAQKVIIDGKVYILRDGKYYTPLGAVCPR